MMLRLNAIRTGFLLGISLVIAGIIYFFAANWGGLQRTEKVWLVVGLVILFYSLFFLFYLLKDRLDYHFFLARIFLVGGCIAFGTAIALLDQIYNAHANSYTLFLIWSIASLLFSWITRYLAFDMLSYILIHLSIWFYLFDHSPLWQYRELDQLLIMLLIAGLNLALWAFSEWNKIDSPLLNKISFLMFHFALIATTNSFWLEHYGRGMNMAALAAIGLGFYYFIKIRWNKTMLALNALVASSFLIFKFIELAIYRGSFNFFVFGLIFVAILLTVNVKFFHYINQKTITNQPISSTDDHDKGSDRSVPESLVAESPTLEEHDSEQTSAEEHNDLVIGIIFGMIKTIGVFIGSISLMGVVFLATGLEHPEYTLLILAFIFVLSMTIFKNIYEVVRYTILTIGYIAGIGGIVGVESALWSTLFTLVLIFAWFRSEDEFQLFLTYLFIQFTTAILLFQWLDMWRIEYIFQIIILILALINALLFILHAIQRKETWGPSSYTSTLLYTLLFFFIMTFFENIFVYSYVLFNLIYFVGVTSLVFWYIYNQKRAETILSMVFWFAFLFYKYYDLLWKLLHKSITLALLGLIVLGITYWIARRRQIINTESAAQWTSSLRKYGLTMISIVIVLQLGWVGYHTVIKEKLLASGTSIKLELAPIDPRSLLQGDYVILNYDISTLPETIAQSLNDQGIFEDQLQIVLQSGSNGVYHINRLYDPNAALQTNEVLITGKLDYGNQIIYGIENYFVPEGTGLDVQQKTKFAYIRVNPQGDALLEKLAVD